MAKPGVTVGECRDIMIKLLSRTDGAVISTAPLITVEYNGNTYTTDLNNSHTIPSNGIFRYTIINFPEIYYTNSVKVTCHLTCTGYSPLIFQCKTTNGADDPTTISLYPITIDGQIQRLLDTKQKFVDAFPTILKKEDSIEDYPKMMEECVPFFFNNIYCGYIQDKRS